MNLPLGQPDFFGRRVLVFDTECTAIDDPEILESAWVELEPTAHIGAFFLLEKPELENFEGSTGRHGTAKPTTLGALAVHGILPDEVKGMPPFSLACLGGAGDGKVVLIGHQVDFDWGAACAATRSGSNGSARSPLDDAPRICTLAMARRIWPDLDSHSLGALVYHVRGVSAETRDVVDMAHGAMPDAMMTMTVLLALLKERPDLKSWEKVWAFSEDCRLPRTWSFGKFEGQPLGAADRGYIGWVRKNCTDRPDWPYLSKALDLMEAGALAP